MFVWQLKSSHRKGRWMVKEGGGFVKVRSGGKYCVIDVKRLGMGSFPSRGSHFLSETAGRLEERERHVGGSKLKEKGWGIIQEVGEVKGLQGALAGQTFLGVRRHCLLLYCHYS